MRLEPLLCVKEHKLHKIADGMIFDTAKLERIELPWSQIQLAGDTYNEEFLAELRTTLKTFEEAGKFAVLVPIADMPLESAEQTESFIAAFNHTARRIKDCAAVAGFEIPPELNDAQDFIDTLAVKHAQYVYFSKQQDLSDERVVLY